MAITTTTKATKRTTTTAGRKVTTKAPSAETKALMLTATKAKAAVNAWYVSRDKADANSATPELIAAAVRIKSAKYGDAWNVAKALDVRNTSDMSRLTTAWTAALAFAGRNGTNAADAFGTFLTLSRNLSGAQMGTIARSTSSLSAATLAGKSALVAVKAKRREANGSTLNGTKVAKASDGKTGNTHGGTGDTSAAKNGDKGDTVSDTLAAAILSVARRVSDAADNGTLTAADMKAINAFEQMATKARKSRGAKADTPATPAKVSA